MNEAYKKIMKQELKDASSLQECFDVLGKYYELEKCTPGFITKNILISKLEDAVKYMKAAPRKQYT